METTETSSRHPRPESGSGVNCGGGPSNSPHPLGKVYWVPAFAGMTFVLAGLGSNAALAHTGAEHALSFASGFAHPLTGLDHMLAMVAVGLWARLNGGRALWAWPAAFVGVMVLGGALGMAGIGLPMVEAGILASVVVLGLLVLAAAQLPTAAGAALVAIFALLHGQAHGAELPGDAAAVTYAAGFAIATAVLHAIGIGVARLAGAAYGRMVVRGAGALVAAAGVALALA
jgi:urease accessory protein